MYAQAAANVAGQPVSVEPDGTAWTGTDPDRTYLDTAEITKEVKRLEKAEAAAQATAAQNRVDAIAHAKTLGFTDSMISVMYPTLTEEA